jgi:SnoaL-like domain
MSTSRTTDLLDRDEIATLVHRLGACLDEGRFDDLRRVFTPDAVASTPGGVAEGIDAMIAQASRNHSPDDGIQHLISDVLVDLDGDSAAVRANLVVTFARRSPAATAPAALGEVYRFAARRTPAGWRLTRVATTPVWVSHTQLEPFGPRAA